MDSLIGIGKYLFAIAMAIFGVFHFMNAEQMAVMVPIAGGKIWIYLSGLGFILAAISIIVGKFDKMACVALAIMLVLFVALIHIPGIMNIDNTVQQASMIATLKDLALAGGALMCASQSRDNTMIDIG